MIKGTTQNGFKFSIPKSRLDNYELLEMIGELEDNPLILPKVVNLILGKEQANQLKDSIRDKDGLVPADKMSSEIVSIFNQSQLKK